MTPTQWTSLEPIELTADLDAAGRDAAEAINSQIADVLDRRRATNEQAADLARGSVADSVMGAETLAANVAATLESEIAVRQELAEFFDAHPDPRYPEAMREREDAFRAIDAAKARVVEGMNAIGFVGDGVKYDQRIPGSIAPGTVATHPDVVVARGRHRELVDRAERVKAQPTRDRTNRNALASAEQSLESLRPRVLAE